MSSEKGGARSQLDMDLSLYAVSLQIAIIVTCGCLCSKPVKPVLNWERITAGCNQGTTQISLHLFELLNEYQNLEKESAKQMLVLLARSVKEEVKIQLKVDTQISQLAPQSEFFNKIVRQITGGEEKRVKQLLTMIESIVKKSENRLTPWQAFVLNFLFYQHVKLETIRVKLIEPSIVRLPQMLLTVSLRSEQNLVEWIENQCQPVITRDWTRCSDIEMKTTILKECLQPL